MSIAPLDLNGHYDENGRWQRTKFCLVSCGSRCDCGPPMGEHYNRAFDQRLIKPPTPMEPKTDAPT